jgi:hypothetical protein
VGEYLEKVPGNVRGHVEQISKSSSLPAGDESVEMIAKAWLEKRDGFERQVAERSMTEIDYLASDEERGALVMTYSGSLINIGPLVGTGRHTEYASVGLRQDVPELATEAAATLLRDIAVDEEVVFQDGPISKSSPVYKIAVPPQDMGTDEQQEELAQVTQVLTEQFVDVNKTIALE